MAYCPALGMLKRLGGFFSAKRGIAKKHIDKLADF